MPLFLPITKIDVVQKRIWAVAADETPDKANEVFDYESSKPYFDEWSGEFSKATDGESFGNVRAMHGKTAAGKVVEYAPDDVEKKIGVVMDIVDPAEWEKVEKKVYTGVSIGGSYVKKWADPDNKALTRYTAKPAEISLVDNPCNPAAKFVMVKADGTTEECAWGESAEKIAAREDTSAKEGEDKYGDVKFADPKNKKYPIDTEQHIRAAWNYINKPKNAGKYSAEDLKTIKDRIIAAWKKTISSDGPPSADDAEKFAANAALVKSLFTVSDLAYVLNAVQNMAVDLQFEADWEGDDSLVPEQLRAWLSLGAEIFRDMAEEEAQEIVAQVSALADKAAEATTLAKAGARHSKADQNMLQQIHDHAVGLGAMCADDGDAAGAEKLAKLAGEREADKAAADAELQKRADQITTLEKSVADLTTEKETLTKRVAELEKEPLPAKGVVRAIDKAADNAADLGKAAADVELAKVADPLAAMKLLHANHGHATR